MLLSFLSNFVGSWLLIHLNKDSLRHISKNFGKNHFNDYPFKKSLSATSFKK